MGRNDETPFLHQKASGLTKLFGFKSKNYAVWCFVGCCFSSLTGFFLGHRQNSKIKWAFLTLIIMSIIVGVLNINVKPVLQEIDQEQIDSNALMWTAIDILSKQGVYIISLMICMILIFGLYFKQRRDTLKQFQNNENCFLTCCILYYCLPCSFGQLGSSILAAENGSRSSSPIV